MGRLICPVCSVPHGERHRSTCAEEARKLVDHLTTELERVRAQNSQLHIEIQNLEMRIDWN